MLQHESVTGLSTKKHILVIESGVNWLDNIFYSGDDSKIALLRIMGKPLLLYNIEKMLDMRYPIDRLILPSSLSSIAKLVQDNFPSMHIDESDDYADTSGESVKLKLNSVITKPKGENNYVIRTMVYPWDVLKVMHDVLNTDVTATRISENASVASTAVVKGPCIIEGGVTIDDFTKIIGPIYIGKDSKIGTGSLVRHSMVGENTTFGFNCEIARSFFMGSTRVAHLDVVLDSVLGHDCWLGGYVGTTNVLLDKAVIRYKLDGLLVSTGLEQLGAVIGYGSAIGAGTVILPGRFVQPNSVIQAGTIVSK